MNNLNSSRLHAVALLPVIFLLASCGGGEELFSKPPQVPGRDVPLTTKTSVVGLLVNVPYTTLQQTVASQVPTNVTGDQNVSPRPCARVNWGLGRSRHCVNVGASYRVQRGEIQFSQGDASSMLVTVPLRFSGQGKLRGSGAIDRLVIDALSLRAKNFDGAATITAVVKPEVGSDWCPKLSAAISVNWTRGPTLEIIDNWNVDIRQFVAPIVNGMMSDLKQQLAGSIPCSSVRDPVAKLFTTQGLAVEIPQIGPMFVNVKPTGAGFSGVNFGSSDLSLAMSMDAQTDVSVAKIVQEALPLPPLEAIALKPPQIQLGVPLRVPYTALEKVADSALKDKVFEVETPLGKGKITTKAVQLYPSGDRIVVGVNAVVDVPGRWFDVKGTVYVLGRPAVNGTVVELQDLAFAQVLDNKLWDTVSLVLKDKILAEISKASRYDMTPTISSAQTSVASALDEYAKRSGLSLGPTNVRLGLGRVAMAQSTVEVEGLFGATLEATIQAVPVASR